MEEGQVLKITYCPNDQNLWDIVKGNQEVMVLEVDSQQHNPNFLEHNAFYLVLNSAENLFFVDVIIAGAAALDNEAVKAKLTTVNRQLIIQYGPLTSAKVIVKEYYSREPIILDLNANTEPLDEETFTEKLKSEERGLSLVVEALKSKLIGEFNDPEGHHMSLINVTFYVDKELGGKKLSDCVFFHREFFFTQLLLLNTNSATQRLGEYNYTEKVREFFDNRKRVLTYIQEGNLEEVKQFVSDNNSSVYLKNRYSQSEILRKAIHHKKFEIYAFLQSVGINLKESKEYSELVKSLNLKEVDDLQKERNNYFVSVEGAHIYFLVSKSKNAHPLETLEEKKNFKEKVESWYRKLDEIPEISPILHVLSVRHSSLEKIIFDFTRESVVGTRMDCSHTTSGITVYQEGRIDVGAKGKSNVVLGVLAHELTHFAICRMYENDYNPYDKSDSSNSEKFKEITENIIKMLTKEEYVDVNNLIACGQESIRLGKIKDAIKEKPGVNDVIKQAFTNYPANHWYSELIVRIPHILAKNEENNGKQLLEDQVKELYDYYTKIVMPQCETFRKESDLIQPRNNIELLNPYLGIVDYIKKLNINFKTPIVINDFLSQSQELGNCKNFLLIETKSIWLSCCNVYQALQENPQYSPKLDQCLFLRLDQYKQSILDIFKSDAIDLLVMIFPGNQTKEQIQYVIDGFKEIHPRQPNKKIIFLIRGHISEFTKYLMAEPVETSLSGINRAAQTELRLIDLVFEQQNIECTLDDLESQGILAEKQITFLGKKKKLRELSEWPKDKIDIETLEKLINDEPVIVGSEPMQFNKLESAYAKLYKQIEENNLADALLRDEKSLFMISGINQDIVDVKGRLISNLKITDETEKTAVKKKVGSTIFIYAEPNKDISLKKFEQLCHDNLNKTIYWINWENDTFFWQQLYNPIYLKRQFQQVVIKKDIKEDLVKTDHSDLFIFSGIANIKELITILEMSENQKKQFLENVNNQRIRLIDSDSAKDNDIENIFQELCISDNYIHWLKVMGDDQKLIWNRSHGSLDKLRKYIEENESKLSFLDEAQFKEQKDRVIIIADKPGMGKSTTLTRLSDLKLETNWIIRIDLKDCQEAISRLPSQEALGLDDVVNFLSVIDIGLNTALAQNLVRYYINLEPILTHNQPSLHSESPSDDDDDDTMCGSLFDDVNDNNIDRSLPLLLLFDGFDEIKGKDHETVVQNQGRIVKLLKYLKDKTEACFWVTTRIHGKENLENELSVFATTLKEFLPEKQQTFLEEFWEARLRLTFTQVQLHDKFGQYTEILLLKTSTVLGEKISSFTGIPLQLRLLAECFQEKFKKFVESSSVDSSIDIPDFNLLGLYQHFINEKYEIYLKEKNGFSTDLNKIFKERLIKPIIKRHQLLAFYELFPSKVKELLKVKSPVQYYKRSDLTFENNDEQIMELCNVGLIQLVKKRFGFIHQTFAEYFVASLLIRRIDRKICSPDKYKLAKQFLLKEMFKDSYEVITDFIDWMSGKESPIHIAILSSNLIEVKKLLSANVDVTDSLERTALHLAAQKGHIGIVNVLLEADYDTLRADVFGKTSLHYAARSSNSNVVERLAEYNNDIDISDNIFKSPLQIDMEVGGSIFNETKYAQSELIKFVNRQDDDGKSSLYYAAEKKDWNVACTLLLYGADSSALAIENKKELLLYAAGKTQSAYANQDHKLRPIVGLLLIKVPDAVRSYSEYYEYPRLLSYFFAHGHIKVIDALLRPIKNEEKRLIDNQFPRVYPAESQGPLFRVLLRWSFSLRHVLFQSHVGCLTPGAQSDIGTYWQSWRVNELVRVRKSLINNEDNCHTPLDRIFSSSDKFTDEVHFQIIKYLLENGATESNFRVGVSGFIKYPSHITKILQAAAQCGHIKTFKYFMDQENQNNYYLHCYKAAQNDQFNILQYLFENHRENIKHDGNTALHTAVDSGANLEIIEYLIDKKENINAKNDQGETPLFLAIRADCRLDIIKYLVDHGANVNTQDDEGNTPLYYAIEKDQQDTINYLLLECNAEINLTYEWIRNKVEFFENPNTFDLNLADQNGMPRLHRAIQSYDLEWSKFIIRKGGDINTKDQQGKMPLHWASQVKNTKIVELLLQYGAIFDAIDINSSTPRALLSQSGSSSSNKIIWLLDGLKTLFCSQNLMQDLNEQLLLTEKNSPKDWGPYGSGYPDEWDDRNPILFVLNARNVEGKTLLHIAADTNDKQAIGILLKFNHDYLGRKPVSPRYKDYQSLSINARDLQGNTALHLAAQKGYKEIISLLLNKGADINAKII